MPYKDPEERKTKHREYMRTRYRAQNLADAEQQRVMTILQSTALTVPLHSGPKIKNWYTNTAYGLLMEAAPLAAKIEADTIEGKIPHNAGIVDTCRDILDRVLGKPKQQIDVSPNEDGLRILEALAQRMEAARSDMS